MAINLADEYNYSNPPSAAYPYGSIKNESTPGADDGTPVDQGWANDIFGFLQGLLSTAGIVPSGTPDTAQVSQYRDAMEALMWQPGDIKVSAVSTAGRRWLEMDGKTIGNAASGASARANADTLALFTVLWNLSAEASPMLSSAGGAAVRGASAAADFAANRRLTIPDMRGEGIRGWDHGRNVDVGRGLGTHQMDALQNITGTFGVDDRTIEQYNPTGAFTAGAAALTGSAGEGSGFVVTFDASRVVRTATETRMRNRAWAIYIRY